MLCLVPLYLFFAAAAAASLSLPALHLRERCNPPHVPRWPVFFIHIAAKEKSDLSMAERCAIESAAAQLPPRPVVFVVDNDVGTCEAEPILSLLSSASNIWIVRLDAPSLFAPHRALANWYNSGIWDTETEEKKNHLSDAVRLALLHRYGGTYLDSDMLLLHRSALARIGSPAVGLEAPWVLNNAVLAFPPRHPFISAAITEFASTFRSDWWGFNGPRLVTRVWAALAASAMHTNLTLHAPAALYPVAYGDAAALFQYFDSGGGGGRRGARAAVASPLCAAHTLHLWNKVSGPALNAASGSISCSSSSAFAATLLGRVMAGVCPRALGTLLAHCDAMAHQAGDARLQSWRGALHCTQHVEPHGIAAVPAPLQPVQGSSIPLALTRSSFTFSVWVRGPAPIVARRAAAAAAASMALPQALGLSVSCPPSAPPEVDGGAKNGADDACHLAISSFQHAKPLLLSSPLVPGRWHYIVVVARSDGDGSRGSSGGAVVELHKDGLLQLQATGSDGDSIDGDGSSLRRVPIMDGKRAAARLPAKVTLQRLDIAALAASGALVSGASLSLTSAFDSSALAEAHNAQRAAFEPPPLALDGGELLALVHPDWRGVRHAHYRVPQFARCSFEIRALTRSDGADALLDRIVAASSLRTLVINGVLDGSADFARRVRAARPDVDVAVVVHSAPSSPDHALEASHIAAVVQASQPRADGAPSAVSRIGFLKAGMSALFTGLGVCGYELSNFPPSPIPEPPNFLPAQLPPLLPPQDNGRALDAAASPSAPPSARAMALRAKEAAAVAARPDALHIFIPGLGESKNVATQLLAACALDGVIIHLVAESSVPYLRACPAPVLVHGELPAPDFAALLARMDVVMYVSLTECSPGVLLESIAAGVPCLTGPTSPIYDGDADLSDLLIVRAPDDPSAIRAALSRLIAVLRTGSSDASGAAVALRPRLLALAAAAAARAARLWDVFMNGRNAAEHCPPPDAPPGAYNPLSMSSGDVGAVGAGESAGEKLGHRSLQASYSYSYSFSYTASSTPSLTPAPAMPSSSYSFSTSPAPAPSQTQTRSYTPLPRSYSYSYSPSPSPSSAAPMSQTGRACASDADCAGTTPSACRHGYCCSPSAVIAGCRACLAVTGTCAQYSPGDECSSRFECGTGLCLGGCCCSAGVALISGCLSCLCGANVSGTDASSYEMQAGKCASGGISGGAAFIGAAAFVSNYSCPSSSVGVLTGLSLRTTNMPRNGSLSRTSGM